MSDLYNDVPDLVDFETFDVVHEQPSHKSVYVPESEQRQRDHGDKLFGIRTITGNDGFDWKLHKFIEKKRCENYKEV